MELTLRFSVGETPPVETGQLTMDYDDYTLAFGYAQTNVGACTLINIYKKVDGVYQTTALTADQLKGLKVGDVLKFGITANADSLRGRFRVTVRWNGGVLAGWDC